MFCRSQNQHNLREDRNVRSFPVSGRNIKIEHLRRAKHESQTTIMENLLFLFMFLGNIILTLS